MSKKINLVIALMTLCTVFLLGLQLYWNYEAYHNSVRVFKSDINEALDKAVGHLMDIRRDEFAAQYKTWLADTNLVIITAHYNAESASTDFTIRDKYPSDDRIPFNIGFPYYKTISQITPEARDYFINRFADDVLANDLKNGSAYYYTRKLGDLMSGVYKADRLNIRRLESLYRQELAQRDIADRFYLEFSQAGFKGWGMPNMALPGYKYSTRHYDYGFHLPRVAVYAYFVNPNLVFFQKMKWVLFSSLILIGITIFCYTYTVKTMLSQKKLTQLKDDFVNNMTHELKTPVATISIAAEAIQNFGLSKVSADEYLSIIRYQASNLTYLIDQILKSMVTDQAIIGINRERILLNTIIGNCIHQYQPQLQAKNATLDMDVNEEELYLNGDHVHIGNVLANLIDNAIKYGSEQPVIELEARVVSNWVELSVTNDGRGIPMEYHDKVFDKFFRIPSGNVHNVKGYGLGLSYARDIVQQHGGSLTLSSTNNTTTFTIKLPLATHETGQRIIA